VSDKVYYIQASRDDTAIAAAWGDLDAMAYHTRKLKPVMDAADENATFIVHLDEVDVVGSGQTVRVLVDMSGDADTVGYVLAKKLRKERADGTPAAAE